MRIATDMQHLLFGAGEEKQLGEEEEPVSTVCYEAEYYSFVPPDTANTKCDLLPDDSQTPPVSWLTPCCTKRYVLTRRLMRVESRVVASFRDLAVSFPAKKKFVTMRITVCTSYELSTSYEFTFYSTPMLLPTGFILIYVFQDDVVK